MPLCKAAATPPAVAAPGEPSSARHVGRIVDPLAREDGETEPELLLEEPREAAEKATDPPEEMAEPALSSEPTAAAAQPPEASPEQPQESGDLPEAPEAPEVPEAPDLPHDPDMHPVKARLLAKARAARGASDSATPGRLSRPSQLGPSERRGLDELGPTSRAHRPPSSPALARPATGLSPNLIALFGTLLGLAVVASLVALAMGIDPQPWEAKKGKPKATADKAPAAATATTAKPKPKRKKLPGPWRVADAKSGKLKRVSGKIGRNPFLRAVQNAGVAKKQAYRLLTAFKGVRNLDNCNRRDQFVALIERSSKRLKAFEYIVSKEEVYQAREGTNGLLSAKRLDLKVDRKQVKGSFTFAGGSFNDAAESAGLERGLAAAVATALDGHMHIAELAKGDRIRVIAQEVTVLGEFSRYAGVEAIEIRPADTPEKPLRVYYFREGGTRGYYDAKGRSPYEGGWRKPVKDAPITSRFNPKRMHPVLKKVMPHNGTDFGAPTGAVVGASSYGTVSFIGFAGASGNLVKVEHAGDIETGYAHLSRFARGLKVGDRVKRLQLVGYVGSTGRSTGPHLHFSVKKDGKFIDPESLNLDGMRVMPKSQRAAFETVKQRYDGLLNAIPLAPPLAAPVESETEPVASVDIEPTAVSPPKGATAEPEAPKPEAAAGAEPAKPGPPATAKPGGGRSVYLTDEDLMKIQGRNDDGEVDE